jgi:hypothetical protein
MIAFKATGMETQMLRRLTMGVVASFALGAMIAGPASAVPEYVHKACKSDYRKFCPSYEVDSSELRQCMRSMERRLSQRCIDALEKSGEKRRK